MGEPDLIVLLASYFGCEDETARRVASIAATCVYAPRQRIARAGDSCRHCEIVIDGTAEGQLVGSDGQRAQLALYEPGEMFGAFPDPTQNRADIIAQTTLTTIRFEVAQLVALAGENAALATGLSRNIAGQLDRLLDRMAARMTLTAPGRVYAALLRIAGKRNIISPPPVIAALALSVHTSRETASRAIGQLERRGIVLRDADRLTIVSRRLLEELVV